METREWLKQCEVWTDRDQELFEIGKASGTAINPKTNKPYTLEEITEIVKR